MEYHIFISHSWSYSDHYDRLLGLSNQNPYFYYRNYSVPKDDPIHNAPNSQLLREAIKRQIQPASCVLILASSISIFIHLLYVE